MDLLLDVDVLEDQARRICELQAGMPEAQIIVFDLCGQVVVERVFDTGAGEPSAGVDTELCGRERVAKEGEGGAGLGLVAPATAAMGTEVEAGPGEDHHRRGWRIHNRRGTIQEVRIGRARRLERSSQRDHADARKDQFLHPAAPTLTPARAALAACRTCEGRPSRLTAASQGRAQRSAKQAILVRFGGAQLWV